MIGDLNNMRTLILSDEETFFKLLEKFYQQLKSKDEVEEFYTEKEAMQLLGISSKSTLFQYRSNGLPYYQIGKRVILYKRSEVIDFINLHKVSGH